MPPRRLPESLSSQSSRVFSGQILDILLHLEREVVTIRKEQYFENDQNFSQQNPKVLSVQTRYYELVQFIQAVPGALLEIIIESLLQIYKQRYDQIDKGEFVYLIICKSCSSILRFECLGPDQRCGGQGILRCSLSNQRLQRVHPGPRQDQHPHPRLSAFSFHPRETLHSQPQAALSTLHSQ